jgi:hypothetical protein
MRYSNVIVSSLCGLLGLTPVVSFHSSTQALIHRKHSNELVHRVGFLSGKITYATSPSGNNDADQSLRDGVKLTSGKKVIEYDSASGRFFETNEGECVPEDEYCAIDDKTGQKIRLTVQEKERIFLDALQVRTSILLYSHTKLSRISFIFAFFPRCNFSYRLITFQEEKFSTTRILICLRKTYPGTARLLYN